MATVEKRGNSYKITVSCGYDINGAQIRRRKTWTPEPGMTARQIEKALERETVLFEEKCRSGQVLDGNVRFADFAEQWFETYGEQHLRKTTLARYRSLLPRVNAAIGHMRIDRIQPHHLMAFYKNLQEQGIRADARYTPIVDFKSLLKERKVTQQKMAALAEVSVQTIRSLNEGKNVAAESARKVAKTLGIPLDQLFKADAKRVMLSSDTVRYHHRLISTILSAAVKWQMIPANPCERVDPPKVEKREAVYLDEQQAARLLELLETKAEPQYKTAIELLLYTGLRRGELCGLEWQDIDFDSAVLHIRRTSLYVPEHGIFTDETKNTSSARSIKIPVSAVTLLKTYRAWQGERRLQLGDQWEDSGRVFTTWKGAPIHPDTLSSWFHDFVRDNDLPDVHLHSLRHTNATLLIAAGTNLQTVASRLGHANSTTTSRIYSHAIRSADAAAADTLQDILHPVKKQA